MAEYPLAIQARRAVTPDGIRPATVAVREGLQRRRLLARRTAAALATP